MNIVTKRFNRVMYLSNKADKYTLVSEKNEAIQFDDKEVATSLITKLESDNSIMFSDLNVK